MVAEIDTLVARARRGTHLDDLGDDGWQLGLAHLLDAVDRDVRDDPGATARIEELIVDRLATRLRIESWYAEHREETTDRVEGPLVILGLPRTATTALHYLLAVDPQFRYLRSWEVSDPVPPSVLGSEHADPRRRREQPAADVRHIVAVDGPAEDWPIHAFAFDHAELTLPVPSHSRWWRGADHAALMPYHDRVLRILHAHRPPHSWLLKMPAYLFLVPQVAAQYPDVRFVMTHRDPVDAIASTCSVLAAARCKRTPSWSPGSDFGPSLLEHWADGMTQGMVARDALGDDRFIDVSQHQLEADPVRTAARIYDFAQLELTQPVGEEMATWSEANRRGSRGEHRYAPEQYDLTAGEITQAFAPYLDRFGGYCSPHR
jgi:hypothetical protein